MRTPLFSSPDMHTARAAALVLLLASLGACGHAAQPDASTEAAATVAIATPSPAPDAAASVAADALAVATASEQASRAAREQTLRVQRQLVERQRALRDAAAQGNGNERCLSGQKMRRVANGWVQAGGC
jgi:hypothetical protein